MRNLHLRFVLCSASQIYSGDFAKFCCPLGIYELYVLLSNEVHNRSILRAITIGKDFVSPLESNDSKMIDFVLPKWKLYNFNINT